MKNQIQIVQVLCGVLFISLSAEATILVCPAKSQVAVVNVGFTYEHSSIPSLPGVEVDKQFYQQISPGLGQRVRNIEDKDITDKQSFLEEIKRSTEKSGFIIFNYSGHGTVMKNGEFTIPLPKIPLSCMKTVPRPADVSQLYRGLYSAGYLQQEVSEKGRGLTPVISDTASTQSLSALPPVTSASGELMTVLDDTKKECEKYYVRASEIKAAIGDKPMMGFIDSCYSGSLADEPGFSHLVSASASQEARDYESRGGLLVQVLKSRLQAKACTAFAKRQMGFMELASGLPKVRLRGEAATIRSIPDLTQFDRTFSESLQQQTLLYVNPAAENACLNIPRLANQHCPELLQTALHVKRTQRPLKTPEVGGAREGCSLKEQTKLEIMLEGRTKGWFLVTDGRGCTGWLPRTALDASSKPLKGEESRPRNLRRDK